METSLTSAHHRTGFKDAVTLRGNVANPGRYVWHQGMRISDLIPNREAVGHEELLSKAEPARTEYRDYTGAEGSLGIQSGAVGDAAVGRGVGRVGCCRELLGRRCADSQQQPLRGKDRCGPERSRYRLELRSHRNGKMRPI